MAKIPTFTEQLMGVSSPATATYNPLSGLTTTTAEQMAAIQGQIATQEAAIAAAQGKANAAVAKAGTAADVAAAAEANQPKPFTSVSQLPPKTEISRTTNPDGSVTINYADGSNGYIPPTTSTTAATTGAVNATRQNIFDAALAQMKSWGLIKTDANGNPDATSQALMSQIKTLAFADAGADTISLALQQSDAYKARFAGNTARLAAGLPALSPADYIATENKYDQVLRAAGVPDQFYRSTGEMAKLIGADVSPTELQNRVDLAAKSILNADPYYTDTLKNYYGLSSGDMIAHVLDPSAAMPLLQQQVSSASIGAEAARQATNINMNYAQQLAAMGVTQAQAAQGFQSIAQQQAATQALASRYGGYTPAGNVGQELQAATFGTSTQTTGETPAEAALRLKRLQTQEASAFGGSAGASQQAQSLGMGNQQGAI